MSKRASETCEQTLHRQEQNQTHDKHKHLSSSLCRGFCTSVLFIFNGFQIFINLATELHFLQIIRKTRQMFGKLDIAVFYPLYGEFNIWDNDVSVCSTPLVTHKFGISNMNCHK